ncbi:MAG: DNA-binding XRE family transcriptional regulator [Parvicellaceae bacterium]|jgi:DNA-binding XRE family transcriptional regulator
MSLNDLQHGEILKETGLKLEAIRKELRMSKVTVADKAGINRKTLERIEKGKNLSYDSLIRLLRVYGILYRLDDVFESPRLSPREKFQGNNG